MQKYEMTLVVNATLEKAVLDKLLAKIKKLVTDSAGKVEKTEEWGKRILAYPLKKQKEGLYYFFELSLEKKDAPAIANKLQMEENLLRHLIVRR